MVLQLIQEQPEVIQAIFRKDKPALEELLGRGQLLVLLCSNVCSLPKNINSLL
jgi:hypothetical protein